MIFVYWGLGGALFGLVSALWMGGLFPGGPRLGNGVSVGGWVGDWSIGSKTASPYVRARVARHGLLALQKQEAVYFTKAQDDQGAALRENCTYKVSGHAMPAAWWSITLYDRKSRLPMNEDMALSFDATRAGDGPENTAGNWSFIISADRPEEVATGWVSSRAADKFDLTLRLYGPSEEMLQHPRRTLRSPSIEPLGCAEEPS